MSHLEKLTCRCAVTAIKFINKGTLLLTAQGPFLSIYDSIKCTCIDTYSILCSNKIHGIRTHSISFGNIEYIIIICFGSRELSISLFNIDTLKISILHSPLLLNDWIFDAKLLLIGDDRFELAVGMMHTQVLLYSLSFVFGDNVASLSYTLIETILTDNTSILYSLSFYGWNRDNLMIAAGDCFNHLLLWNVFDMESNKVGHQNKCFIKFRGRRKGAIYDISWSKNGKYLCYASDDRSVQLWRFNNASALQMVYRVYGHQGRVFRCWISEDAEYVVSCSEDSTCRVWNFDGELIDSFEFRYGGIWSLDVIKSMNLYHVALGGADSSIRFHYFLDKKESKNIKTIALNSNHSLNHSELTPFQHHLDSKAFYQINLPNKYFPKQKDKKRSKRGKKRNQSKDNIRIMIIDSESRIVFATASDVYRVSNLNALSNECKWEKIIALKDIFKQLKDDEITTIKLSRDLFSDYGHYRDIENVPSDLLSKYDISTRKYSRIPEDASDSLISSPQMSLNANIKKTDRKIAENLHNEYERWLIIGTSSGRICIVDLTSNQNALCFRAHDIGIISIYLCITSFQPETLHDLKQKHRYNSQLRFSLSASDLHSVMSNPSLNEEYLRMWGNSSLMLFTSDGNGNITYWCFPLSELQKPKASVMETQTQTDNNDSVKFDTIQSAMKSSAMFMNPAKKQISAFCYLPPPKNILIVGDARGNIMLFSLLNLQNRSMHKPIQILKSMHGRDPVSVIKVLSGIKYIHNKSGIYNESKEEESDSNSSFSFYKKDKYHIVSGGKDGKIVEYTFYTDVTHKRSTSRSEHNLMLPIVIDNEILTAIRGIASTSMSSIDDIMINENCEMICSGFRSTHFIVWNIAMDYVLFRWNCGGVKRPHYFSLLNGGGWIFAYTNSNLSNCIAVYHLDLVYPIALGSLHKPYHSSEIHSIHWLLSPKELYIVGRSDDIYSEIEEFVANHSELQAQEPKEVILNEYISLSEYFKKVMIVSSGEDGLVEIISIFGDKNKVKMEQNGGNRFPLKCSDMVRKSLGNAYLLFCGGAKEYLQAFEVSYNDDKPEKVFWKSLCSTGGDKKSKKRNDDMDLRIKCVVVIPNPKYYGKWLIITGNSRGIIRSYTLDEDKACEFQFEGQDSLLHIELPILSLCCTYSSQRNYHNYHNENKKNNKIIANYNELPPHLIFSGATDGWIRIWYWNMDSHCIDLLLRLAIHQNGVNAISSSWLDAKFIVNKNGLLNRRLSILTGGDDQSLMLIIARFESTTKRSRRKTQWKLNVIKEIAINTAHCSSIRSVVITPIITRKVVQFFNNKNINDKYLKMEKILLISTGDDQMLKCWYYEEDKICLLDESHLDISLPNSLSMYYIYNSGILLSVAGHGIQIVTLPFKKYKIFHDI